MSCAELCLHLDEEYLDEFIHEVNDRGKAHRFFLKNTKQWKIDQLYEFGHDFEDRGQTIWEGITSIVRHFSSTRGLKDFLW